MSIQKIFSRYVYDSRGNPTVEVEMTTDMGMFRSIVPSGASTGIHEAMELRDEDKSMWMGKGVLKAVKNVNDVIAPKMIAAKLDVKDQKAIDQFMLDLDGTRHKTNLGANAILGVSLCAARAAAAEKHMPLYKHLAQLAKMPTKPFVIPVPFMNVLNGGVHAGGRLALQEFMICPIGAKDFHEAMRFGSETYHHLKNLAKAKYGSSAGNVGDEGGVAPNINSPEEALDLIVAAIDEAGHTGDVKICVDSASSEFYHDGKYDLDFKNPKSDPSMWKSSEQMADLYLELLKKYPIIALEDPFAEDDWDAWTYFFKKCPVEVIADDLTVTDPERIQKAITNKCANALLLKVNQIGTLTESITAAQLSYANNWGILVSHRSGETEDTFIADLVVAFRTGHIKTGAAARSERLSKYNQIMRIEEELQRENNCVYAGKNFHTAEKL